jgi:hypothetical protein
MGVVGKNLFREAKAKQIDVIEGPVGKAWTRIHLREGKE